MASLFFLGQKMEHKRVLNQYQVQQIEGKSYLSRNTLWKHSFIHCNSDQLAGKFQKGLLSSGKTGLYLMEDVPTIFSLDIPRRHAELEKKLQKTSSPFTGIRLNTFLFLFFPPPPPPQVSDKERTGI